MSTTTRFYFSSSTAAAVSPAFDSDWGATGSAVRRKLKTTPAGTGSAGSVTAAETSATQIDVLNGQFVSDGGVLPVGPIAGTFNFIMGANASGSGAADAMQQLRLHVFDSTGATKRGTIYDGQTATSVSATASDPNGEIPSVTETRILVGIPLVDGTTAQSGDLLVAEYGARFCNTSTTSRNVQAVFRDDGVSDYAHTAGLTANGRPWLDMILLAPPNVPTSLGETHDYDSIDFTWAAPSGGDAATGYEVRINGGSWIDVGNVFAHTFGSLTELTTYTLEVRAYNGAGAGTSDDLDATTDAAPVAAAIPDSAQARVPLTVRVGDRFITQRVSGLSFREEAVGGVKSISLRLASRVDRFDPNLDPFSEVTLFDGRNAEIVARGRLTDPGRSASAGDGQQWDMTAFAPSLGERTFPYVVVDSNTESFTRSTYCTRGATTGTDERDENTPSLLLSAEEGKTVSTSWIADMIYRGIRQAGMKLARVSASVDCGVSDANYTVQLVTRTGTGGGTTADSAASSTTTGALAAVVVTDFTNADDVVSVRTVRDTSGTTGAEAHWFEFWDITRRALLLNAAGTEITTGYTQDYVFAHEVVTDLLGRVLDQIDGANSVVAQSATYQIDQLAYPDGVTAEQVLTDLMALEPAYRWWIEPTTAGTYVLRWELWPTAVRYEVTLNGGGDFPGSSQELYNEVTVRWRGANGQVRATAPITAACPVLDAQGITRSYMLDLGDEIGSSAAATRAGENFLAEHNAPANAGTVVVDRPIRDLVTHRIVRPHQIKAGELIRVRGLESRTDALNADGRDGQTVFRIWSKTYNSDSDSAALELDIPSRSTTNALVKVAKRRPRKR